MAEKTQKPETEAFKIEYNRLLGAGIIKNGRKFCQEIGWDETSLSQMLAGKRDVPKHVIMSFNKLYRKENSALQVPNIANDDKPISLNFTLRKLMETRRAINHQIEKLEDQLLLHAGVDPIEIEKEIEGEGFKGLRPDQEINPAKMFLAEREANLDKQKKEGQNKHRS